MVSKQSKKLKKASVIMCTVFFILGLVLVALAVLSSIQADQVKELIANASFFEKRSLQAEYEAINTMKTMYLCIGIFMFVCGLGMAVLMLGIYYKTYISIEGNAVKGVGTVGLSRKAFSAPLQNVTNPSLNNNKVAFKINNVTYSVFADDADVVYRMLMNK